MLSNKYPTWKSPNDKKTAGKPIAGNRIGLVPLSKNRCLKKSLIDSKKLFSAIKKCWAWLYDLKKYPLPSSTGRLISKMCHMVMAIIGKMQIIIIYIWWQNRKDLIDFSIKKALNFIQYFHIIL